MNYQIRPALAGFFFFLFIFLKQFYIFPSGVAGAADICMFIAFLLVIMDCIGMKADIFQVQEDRLLYLFLLFVVAINSCYWLQTEKREFLKYTIFWFYNVGAIWTFRKLTEWKGEWFLLWINRIAKGNVVLQLIVYVTGQGRVFQEYWGATRYQGTFNDPNQLAVFVFMMIMLLYMYQCKYQDRTFWIFYILAMPVIIASKSTGVLLGLLVFTVMALLYIVYGIVCRYHISKRLCVLGMAGVGIVLVLFLWWIWPSADFDVKMTDYDMLARIQEKIWKIIHGGLGELFLDRGMDKLLLYPKYLLYGAGEGGFDRFVLARQCNEIHCCLFSIMFCYGILPTVIVLVWLIRNLRNTNPAMKCAVAGLLAESFFLINYRQPVFWMILLYGSVVTTDGQEKKRREKQ